MPERVSSGRTLKKHHEMYLVFYMFLVMQVEFISSLLLQ